MFQRTLLPVLAAATVTIAAMPVVAHAELQDDEFDIPMNGLSLHGIRLSDSGGSGPGDDAAFHAVRLTLPDGAELTFR
jgi:hypothetical protein